MSFENLWGHFFKPEVRASGAALTQKIHITAKSATRAEAIFRGTGVLKIAFTTSSIGDDTLFVSCTCPSARRGQFCKHIWATLLRLEKEDAEILTEKVNLEQNSAPATPAPPPSEKMEALKALQSERRKNLYLKQKARQKEFQQARKNQKPSLSADVARAFEFFSENGFSIEGGEEPLREAKKKLAKIFHPDVGGSHEEAAALNLNFDVLLRFFAAQSTSE